jgi:hypothetical protein
MLEALRKIRLRTGLRIHGSRSLECVRPLDPADGVASMPDDAELKSKEAARSSAVGAG